MKVSRLIYEAIRFQVELDYCDRHGLTHYYFNKDEADRLSVLEEVVAYYNDIYDHVVEIWCQLHRPMELLENINRYVSVLTAEKDIFDIEPAYNVILKAFSENPELSDPYGIAPRILEFLQHEPVLINIPYNVLGIQHTAWHKDELVSMVGVGPGYTAIPWKSNSSSNGPILMMIMRKIRKIQNGLRMRRNGSRCILMAKIIRGRLS